MCDTTAEEGSNLPPELEVIKDIPCYRVILKAILKYQIQQLLTQLSEYTEEESIILSACLSDQTFSYLGTRSGKTYLEEHEELKTSFLDFCMQKQKDHDLSDTLESDSSPSVTSDPQQRIQESLKVPRKGAPTSMNQAFEATQHTSTTQSRVTSPSPSSSQQQPQHPIHHVPGAGQVFRLVQVKGSTSTRQAYVLSKQIPADLSLARRTTPPSSASSQQQQLGPVGSVPSAVPVSRLVQVQGTQEPVTNTNFVSSATNTSKSPVVRLELLPTTVTEGVRVKPYTIPSAQTRITRRKLSEYMSRSKIKQSTNAESSSYQTENSDFSNTNNETGFRILSVQGAQKETPTNPESSSYQAENSDFSNTINETGFRILYVQGASKETPTNPESSLYQAENSGFFSRDNQTGFRILSVQGAPQETPQTPSTPEPEVKIKEEVIEPSEPEVKVEVGETEQITAPAPELDSFQSTVLFSTPAGSSASNHLVTTHLQYLHESNRRDTKETQYTVGSSTATQDSADSSIETQNSAGSATASQHSVLSSTATRDSAGRSRTTQSPADSSVATQNSTGSSTSTQNQAESSVVTKNSAGSSRTTRSSAERSIATWNSTRNSTSTQNQAESSVATKNSAGSSRTTRSSADRSIATWNSTRNSTSTQNQAESSVTTKDSAGSSRTTQSSAESSIATRNSTGSSTSTQNQAESSVTTKDSAGSSIATRNLANSSVATQEGALNQYSEVLGSSACLDGGSGNDKQFPRANNLQLGTQGADNQQLLVAHNQQLLGAGNQRQQSPSPGAEVVSTSVGLEDMIIRMAESEDEGNDTDMEADQPGSPEEDDVDMEPSTSETAKEQEEKQDKKVLEEEEEEDWSVDMKRKKKDGGGKKKKKKKKQHHDGYGPDDQKQKKKKRDKSMVKLGTLRDRPRPGPEKSKDVAKKLGLTNIELVYTEDNFEALTNYKLFREHVQPVLAKHNPKVAPANLVTLLAAKWREFAHSAVQYKKTEAGLSRPTKGNEFSPLDRREEFPSLDRKDETLAKESDSEAEMGNWFEEYQNKDRMPQLESVGQSEISKKQGCPLVVQRSTQEKAKTLSAGQYIVKFYQIRKTQPTKSSVSPTMSSVSPTMSSVSPTMSSVSPTMSSVSPTMSSVSPTMSSVSPTMSSVPPTMSSVPSTTSSVSQTMSSVLPTISSVSPKMSSVSPTISFVSPTMSSVSPTMSSVSPKMSSVPPTMSSVSPTISSFSPTMSSVLPTMSSASLNKKSTTLSKRPRTPAKRYSPSTNRVGLPTKRSDLPTKRSTIATKRSALATKRSALRTKRSTIATKRSALTTKRSALTTKRSVLITKRSALPTKRSTIATKRSALPTKRLTKRSTASTKRIKEESCEITSLKKLKRKGRKFEEGKMQADDVPMETSTSDTVVDDVTVATATSETVTQQKEKLDKNTDDDGESEDEDFNEESIMRDVDNPNIYITKVITSSASKYGRAKKTQRVYNSYQYCSMCEKKVSNLSQHLSRNCYIHNTNEKIKEIQEETDEKTKKKLQRLLRGKFNHDYNMITIRKGKGEILLERRPTKQFRLQDYGPCPNCLLWFSKVLLKKHSNNCANRKVDNLTVGDLTTQSECISGQLTSVASKQLVKKVFSKMRQDEISEVVKGDMLITQLGNQWIEKNVGNVLKRGVYTSQILRLIGRFLIILRRIKPLKQSAQSELWDYLKPAHFDAIVKACILTASPFDEEEDFKAPSNAIKIGYDLRRLVSGKLGLSITHDRPADVKDAEKMLKLMTIYWDTKVTKAARVILLERSYFARKNLPLPEDIQRLTMFLRKRLEDLDYTEINRENHRQIAETVQAKLVIYNRRRTGMMQAARLRDYDRRCFGIDGEHLVGSCSELEKKLLESREVMTIRGKVGRAVPVILPDEVMKGLEYLTDPSVRSQVGISPSNSFLFAAEGESIVWAYDSVRKASQAAGLDNPHAVTSTSLRKYMATVTQVLDLKESQMQWVANHLRHTMDAHKIHYRATSDILERTQIVKLFLLQDQGRIGQFRNRDLEEIDLKDVVFQDEQKKIASTDDDGTLGEAIMREMNAMDFVSPDVVSETLNEAETFYGETEVAKPRERPVKTTKPSWTKEEEKEIRMRFKVFFDKKVRPKPADCVRVIAKSKKESGLLGRRRKDVLKKKVFRMIDKLQKNQ